MKEKIYVKKHENPLKNRKELKEEYNPQKIIDAANKSALRSIQRELTPEEQEVVISEVEKRIAALKLNLVPVEFIHDFVEDALMYANPIVSRSYSSYRFRHDVDKKKIIEESMADDEEVNSIYYRGDKENSNADSALVSTKRSLGYNVYNKRRYQTMFLTEEELEAVKDGYIYVHDQSARMDTMNCCLFDVGNVLEGGFEMGNMWYNEPKSLDVAFDLIGDIVLSAASQQYGGFTIPQIPKILAKYARKTYETELEYLTTVCEMAQDKAEREAWKKTKREAEQGFQGLEYKLNTVASSRGDYPFTTFTGGVEYGEVITVAGEEVSIEEMLWEQCLLVRKGGQGKPGHKKPVLFPKLVFLYDEKLHGEGGRLQHLFEVGVDCSMRCMYPDWLSMSGEGYIASMYKQYGKVISPMGCRAFLSPWWEKGGMYKADETDTPVFVGRFNIGAISLHLPMILAKSREEGKDFYEVLDYYLELIRHIHIRTYAYLGEMKASTNPLAYTQGGFYGGNLQPEQRLKESPLLLKCATASFGITAFNELQELYNNHSLVEDGNFALDVLRHLNEKITQFKEEDGNLYAIYGTPAEGLCGKQVKQFRNKYGIIKNVSDREYVSNSFHCHVTEDICPTEKQDKEFRFWELSNGGKIQYVRYPLDYNRGAVEALIKRAMAMGLYEGVNLSLAYCDDCGHQELEMDVCPKCGSRNLTKIDRMNGYLSYSRVHGQTRLNDAKMAEIADRKSM